MTTQIVKAVLIGMLVGTALFFTPFFFLRILLFVLIIGALFRFFSGHRFRRWGYASADPFYHPAFTDTIRSMSEEDYQAFRKRFESYPNRNAGKADTSAETKE